ncbi:MAG: hypothetical protein H0V09_00450 [Gemmatimonadetes bacterium]|nr:hypothetical protein [Gemmatimonadota bacterium]
MLPLSLRGSTRALLARGLAAGVLLAAAGCRSDAPVTIPREKFVEAYVRLVRARIDAEEDSGAYLKGRDAALHRTGVTPADLRAYVEAGNRDPEALRVAWQEIAAKLDTLYGGVTSELSPEMREALRAARGSEPLADTIP